VSSRGTLEEHKMGRQGQDLLPRMSNRRLPACPPARLPACPFGTCPSYIGIGVPAM
jgi:hypothetical protein